MDDRSTSKHDRGPCAIGTIKLRRRKQRAMRTGGARVIQVRFIKWRDDGPYQAANWMPLARWWWIQNRGRVPRGMRVCHTDGDTLNDDPSGANYELWTPADVIGAWQVGNPELAERGHRAAAAACAEHNRERARIRMIRGELAPSRWYAVNEAKRLVLLSSGFRKRWMVYAAHGVPIISNPNGRGWLGAVVGWRDLPDGSAAIVAVLADGVGRDYRTLAGDAAALTVKLRGSCPVHDSSWAQYMIRLNTAGFIARAGVPRIYRITETALAARTAPSDVIAMRGADITAAVPPLEVEGAETRNAVLRGDPLPDRRRYRPLVEAMEEDAA